MSVDVPSRAVRVALLLGVVAWGIEATAEAQALGTFRWQTAPFCNVVTLTVTQQPGGVFTLDGFDDRCGAPTRATAGGTAVPNLDGTVELALTIVGAPDASPVHLTVPVNLSTLGGSWRDNAGNSGPFRFTPGPGTAGTPRPAIVRDPAAPVLPTTVDGTVDFNNPRGIVATAPGSGALHWLAPKQALRAGVVSGTQWNDENVGEASVAFGVDTIASGTAAFAAGRGHVATDKFTTASGANSVATGFVAIARAANTFAAGDQVTAMQANDVAFGHLTRANGPHALAAGEAALAGQPASLAVGFLAEAGRGGSVALGSAVTVLGFNGVALGQNVRVSAGAFGFGDASGFQSFIPQPERFDVRAAGGFGFYTNPELAMGVELPPNSSQFTHLSDARAKEHFRDLDTDALLAGITRMPVREWSYKAQGVAIRHVGPTAQDFHAAFGLGEDPLRIGTLDADGVGLAAAKALEVRTRALVRDNAELRRRIAGLVERLNRLTDAVQAGERQ